ncbi:hypothetical protein JW960_21560 [candidate division KSB1 bacterium]|nr:hypothetical protein [candidate division KSB1 bacterium]
MTYHWHDFVGNIGVLIILFSYLFVQLGKLKGTDVRYSLLNMCGAFLIMVSLIVDFNLSAFLIEACWVVFSFVGVVRYFSKNENKEKI